MKGVLKRLLWRFPELLAVTSSSDFRLRAPLFDPFFSLCRRFSELRTIVLIYLSFLPRYALITPIICPFLVELDWSQVFDMPGGIWIDGHTTTGCGVIRACRIHFY